MERDVTVIIRLTGKASQVWKLLAAYCQQHGNKTLNEIAKQEER